MGEGEKLLSGKDGVHSWRTQKHLQGEGEACRKPVNSFCKYFVNKQTYISITTRSDIMLAFIIKKIFLIFRDTMCPKDQALLEYSRIFLNCSTLQLPIFHLFVINHIIAR